MDGHEQVDSGLVDIGESVEMLAIGLDFMKARPAEEGGKRVIYCEASNEAWDQEKERILKSALMGSRDLFLSKGNLDIDHLTILGHRMGIENPHIWEIGRPLDVRESASVGGGVYVKGAIYQGNEKADWFWKTITEQDPPMQWFPSVGGKPLERKRVHDKVTGIMKSIVTKAMWRNLAFAKEPQNLTVPAAQTVGFGAFAKAVQYAEASVVCTGDQCVCIAKAVEAGAQVSPEGLEGGGALRLQSHAGRVIHATQGGDRWGDKTRRYLKAIQDGTGCEHVGRGAPMSRALIEDHFQKCEGLAPRDAKTATARMLVRLQRETRAAA